MFAGQLMVGGVTSLTVTVNVQVLVLGTVSVAVQVTVVTPFGKVEPDVGEQVTLRVPSQLSLAIGKV
jgi:hypothetical protein